jgi:alginate O-acetyltransferase complex protein AlgI
MLFNSIEFIAAFLPLTLAVFFVLGRFDQRLAAGWLVLASLAFYGWWDIRHVPLLVGSIAVNFSVGRQIALNASAGNTQRGRLWLTSGIVADLALLGWFKYAAFFTGTVNTAFGWQLPVPQIVLPLGISFFTFTQIAYLVDVWQGKARDYQPVHYGLFVTYFPHLIAGPILHHKQMMPQFERPGAYRASADRIAEGSVIFLLGLAKKTVLADRFGELAAGGFAAAGAGHEISFFAAWGAALGYTFQLYFDFSGYSDMAIGLGRMIGIELPQNFNSPYKARSIIDFWRRWHMTLSAFLRDYVYIPLGGNRHGPARRQVNVLITMLLGGLWHGAGWTFVIWGGIHGVMLVINHGWRGALAGLGARGWRLPAGVMGPLYWLLTFGAVVLAWVFFRAESLAAALQMLKGMAGLSGAILPDQVLHMIPPLAHVASGAGNVPYLADGTVMGFFELCAMLGIGLLGVLALPNVLEQRARIRYLFLAISGAFAIQRVLFGRASEFLYFQF